MASTGINMTVRPSISLALRLALPAFACAGLLTGCRPPTPVDNHPTINLFGFEESALHHIHNTIELHRNIFLVRYDTSKPNELEWVNCPISANYEYRKASGRRVESMHISSFADLQARVPVNYARFEAYVKGGKQIDFNYVTIGSYELIGDFRIPADDPDCARATHYVVTLSVGAFNFAEQAQVEGGVKVDVAGTGAGGEVKAGGSKGETTSMGDLDACMDDARAFTDCFTPLQIMMVPLASRHWSGEEVVAATESAAATSTAGGEGGPTAGAATESSGLALVVDAEQWRPGSFMALALEKVLVIAARINDTTDFGFDDQSNTVAAGYVVHGKPHSLTRPFEAGQTYVAFATGATDTGNLDIVVLDADGNELTADRDDDNNPAVSFVPPVDGNYELRLELDSDGDEFGAMVVMREGGLRIEPEVLQGAFQTLMDNATAVSIKVEEMGFPNGLLFHEKDWALTGTVLYPGEAIRQRNITLEPNSAVFSAVAHDETMNIDLEIIENSTGRTFADTEPDANPLVIVDSPLSESTYDMRVIYGEGEGPVLATALILTLGG